MKKYILNDSYKKEVKVGDTLSCSIIVSKSNLPKLIEKGIIKDVTPITWNTIIKSIENKPGYVIGTIDSLYYVSPISLFHLMLREVAILMDQRYEGHIKECGEVYILTTVQSLRIAKYNINDDTTFESFAAFRTSEDIEKARQILMPLIEKIYDI